LSWLLPTTGRRHAIYFAQNVGLMEKAEGRREEEG